MSLLHCATTHNASATAVTAAPEPSGPLFALQRKDVPVSTDRFDRLTQELGTTQTRRSMLGRMAVVAGVVGLAFATSATTGQAATKKACARLGQPCGAAVTDPEHYPTVCCPGLTCGVDGRCVAA